MRNVTKETSTGGASSSRSKGLASGSFQSQHSKKVSPSAKSNGLLFLKENHAKFTAPSKKESVFFDECNREIISLTCDFENTNKTRVVFKQTNQIESIEFLLPIGKRILSIKLNPSKTVLAYHIERNVIEFINVIKQTGPDKGEYTLDSRRYVQSSRAKNSKLVGFLWTGDIELVIITDLSVEFYLLDRSRHRLNNIKMFQSTTNWFVYQPAVQIDTSGDQSVPDRDPYSILMVSTGSQGNSMQPYMFSERRISRLQRFEVEGNWQDSEKMELFERSITIARIYGFTRLLVLQHESLNVRSKGAQIVLYTVDPESGLTSKTHTLDLDVSGRFAINVLDNLVIAHDQPSKSSFMFDIMIEATEKSDCPNHFVSLIDSGPIKQLARKDGKLVDMYSLDWVFFQPNYIVDARLGLLTTLELDYESLHLVFKDNNLMLQFLARRTKSCDVIVRKCREIVQKAYERALCLEDNQPHWLAELASTFEQLARLVISAPELTDIQSSQVKGSVNPDQVSHKALSQSREAAPDVEASIYQEDIQREIFRNIENQGQELNERQTVAHNHFISSALLEFVYAARRNGKVTEFCICDQLLRCLIREKRHFQVVQLIRGEILRDSKQLACSLLALKDQYRPAAQHGLDMLHRLTGAELPAGVPLDFWVRDE